MSETLYEKATKLVHDVNDLVELICSIRLKNIYNDGVKKFELMREDQKQLERLKDEISLNARSLNNSLNRSKKDGRLHRKFKDYTNVHDIKSYLEKFFESPSLDVLKELEIAAQSFQESNDFFFFPVMKRDAKRDSYSKIAQAMLAYRRSVDGCKEIKLSQSASVSLATDEDFELTSESAEIKATQAKSSKIDFVEKEQQKLINLELDMEEFDAIFYDLSKIKQKSIPEDEEEDIPKFERTAFNEASQRNLIILDKGFSMLYAELRNFKSCFFDFKINADGEECGDRLKQEFLDTQKVKIRIRKLILDMQNKFSLEIPLGNVLIQLKIEGIEQRDEAVMQHCFSQFLAEAHHLYRIVYFRYVNIEESVKENLCSSEQQASSVRFCSGI